MFETTVTGSYAKLRSLYVPADALSSSGVTGGSLVVLVHGDEEFSVEGTLGTNGLLSGMAKLYQRLDLVSGDTIEFDIQNEGDQPTITVLSPPIGVEEPETTEGLKRETVFAKKAQRWIHLEVFRPENLNNWEPETETDVYLAFGVLQEYTDYQYCCGASVSVLRKLGIEVNDSSKPDAILVDRRNDEYLLAEWKKHSADFKLNHEPEDVDILVCWHDNETQRARLPVRVLALHGVAKLAVKTAIG